MSDDFDLDSVLGIMEEAASAEKLTDYEVAVIVERDQIKDIVSEATEFVDDTSFQMLTYDEAVSDKLKTCDLILFECRLLEGLADLKIITQMRHIRPQIPLMVVTANQDAEYISACYEQGASDCVGVDINWQVLASKITATLKTSKIMGMFEFKNEEVISTMRSLRKVNDAMRQEKISRIVAETEQDFAEEAAEVNRQMKEILDHLREGFST